MLPIRIMTRDFQLIAEVTKYASLQIPRSWSGNSTLELRINRYIKGANELLRGRIIFPHGRTDKAFVIRHKEIELDENGKATENWIIRAPSLKSWIAQRITYPPSHTAQDNKQSDAETVMLHYVANNATTPVDVSRKIPDLVLAPNQHRGETVSWNSRYKNLAEELAEIGTLAGMGWNVEIDLEAKKYVFRVLEGLNRTSEQTVNPPATFSPEFGTLQQLQYVESDLDYQNVAIVAGQGEGVDRRIIEVGTQNGFDRYELFVDARDIEEETQPEEGNPVPRPPAEIEADLVNRGNQKLAEHEQEIYLEGQTLPKSRLIYGVDYDLGDMVTLQNKEWGVTLDARITEVKEIYEPGNIGLELTFDNRRPTPISKIKQELAGVRNEIVR